MVKLYNNFDMNLKRIKWNSILILIYNGYRKKNNFCTDKLGYKKNKKIFNFENFSIKRPRRFHLGTVTLRDIRKFQKTSDLLTKKSFSKISKRDYIGNFSIKKLSL